MLGLVNLSLLVIAAKFHRFHFPRPFVGDPCRILFCTKPNIWINDSTSTNTQVTGVHVLAGCLETGLDSGPGDARGRLVRVCSESTRLAFRDSVSRRVPETSVAGAGTGLTEHSGDASSSPLSRLNAETLIGSETVLVEMGCTRDHQSIRRAYTMMALEVATRTLAGSVGTYVTVLRVRSNRSNHVSNVHEFPKDPVLTERNSLVANAAASGGDNSVKIIVIGFLEESPRVNLGSEERFNIQNIQC